jgi:hypothetical protein
LFSDIFSGTYRNQLPNFLHLDSALSENKCVTLVHHGKTSLAWITTSEWKIDDRYASHTRGGNVRVKLELMADNF